MNLPILTTYFLANVNCIILGIEKRGGGEDSMTLCFGSYLMIPLPKILPIETYGTRGWNIGAIDCFKMFCILQRLGDAK